MRRIALLFVFAALLAGCGSGGGEVVPAGTATGDTDAFSGSISVGLTDSVPETGSYTLKNAFPRNIKEIIAVVELAGAREGTAVRGEWYQLGTLQIEAQGIKPRGALISEAGFELSNETIDPETHTGGGRLRLVPNAPLPPDSYLLRVYVDDQLARTVGFVIQ